MKKVLSLLALGVAACGGAQHTKSSHALADLTTPLMTAFREEAIGDPAKAIDLYVDALKAAGDSPDNPSSVTVAMAALDALVQHDVAAFADLASSSALVDRTNVGVDAKLAKVDASGPFVPGLIANARLALAERRGDAAAASKLRAASGCAREASVVGPLAYMTVSGAKDPPLLPAAGTMPADVKGPGPFLPVVHPMRVSAFGCRIPMYGETGTAGVREVAVDVESKSGTIGVSLRAASEAVLYANGQRVLERPHALGARSVPRFARIETGGGTIRLVARVGMDQDYENIELDAWDEDGKPLKKHAPAVGSKADAKVKRVEPVVVPEPKSDPQRVAVALGALAGDDTRTAENLLASSVAQAAVSPEVLLTYARAVRRARDLPAVKAQERARAAIDRVLEAWPSSWEAAIEHAVLAGARRGRAEADLEALSDLDALHAKTKTFASPTLLDAFEAAIAGREGIYDRAKAALERAKGPLDGTLLLSDVDHFVNERTGKDLVASECGPRASDHTSLSCHHALAAAGDREGAEKELVRLRALAETPQLYLSLSSRSALEVGDLGRAQKLLDAMNPGDRPLSSVYATKGKAALPEIMKLATTARDSPAAIPSILRDAGDDPIAPFDKLAEKAVGENPATAANAATSVLAHRERYDVEASGLVHYTMFDVRRVMGTTDVDSNAQAAGPTLFGKDTMRVLRRRIFKKDGRIILPDRTPRASQSHADLSQLEAGDAVEAIYEGWGLPNETGSAAIDSPDMLPERTAVKEAVIELSFPPALKHSVWAHPMMGQAVESSAGGKKVLTWTMKDRPIRRVESGVAKMDRNVGISFSTATWADVGLGLRETVQSLEAPSPEVDTWAREAAGKLQPSKELVEKVVAASGQAVKEASGALLTDVDVGRAGGQGMTARGILVTHEGSRTWLLVQALRSLGVPTDIAVAENDPFSESASFPPHYGRFMHPLAVAHVPGKSGTENVWIDADVPGPPLPAGRISPELRGRSALTPDGRIEPLPPITESGERDEIDIRLTLDDQGNAKGTLTVLLRGASGQDLAEALVRLVGLERQRALRGIALGWVPFATIEKVELSSSEGSWQVAMRADLTAPAYAQVEGQKPETRMWVLPGMDPVHYVFPRPFVTTLSATYATQAARESALAINRATQYHVRRRIELPPKASISRLPGPFEGKGPLINASRKISVAGQTVDEEFTLDVTTGTVPQAKYDAFVSSARQTDDAFRASTRIKPAK